MKVETENKKDLNKNEEILNSGVELAKKKRINWTKTINFILMILSILLIILLIIWLIKGVK